MQKLPQKKLHESVIIGILPYVMHKEVDSHPNKKPKKVVEKALLPH